MEYQYRTTSGPRKAWDGEPDLALEGWELIHFERYEYHEEKYWRRKILLAERPEVTALVEALRLIASDVSNNGDFYLQHTAQEALAEYRAAVEDKK